jgi:hypothetical protein
LALVFLVVIPAGDLLLSFVFALAFAILSPKDRHFGRSYSRFL